MLRTTRYPGPVPLRIANSICGFRNDVLDTTIYTATRGSKRARPAGSKRDRPLRTYTIWRGILHDGILGRDREGVGHSGRIPQYFFFSFVSFSIRSFRFSARCALFYSVMACCIGMVDSKGARRAGQHSRARHFLWRMIQKECIFGRVCHCIFWSMRNGVLDILLCTRDTKTGVYVHIFPSH